jgi:hypothetical protein
MGGTKRALILSAVGLRISKVQMTGQRKITRDTAGLPRDGRHKARFALRRSLDLVVP